MNDENIQIWDEIYPCEFLHEYVEKTSFCVMGKQYNIGSFRFS